MTFDTSKILKTYPNIPKDYLDLMIQYNGSCSLCGYITIESPTESESMFPNLENSNRYLWIMTDMAGKWIGYEKDRWRIVGVEEIEQRIRYIAFDLNDLRKVYSNKPELF